MKLTKKLLAIMLSLIMVFSMIAVVVSATETTIEDTVVEEVVGEETTDEEAAEEESVGEFHEIFEAIRNLIEAIHNLVGDTMGALGKECPFCDQVHGDKTDDEIEEPTEPIEPTDPTEPVEKTYSVTFNTNGGSEVEKQTINEGEVVNEPEKPTKEGFSFDGWYTDEDLTEKFDFVTVITSDITLYAGWEEKSEAEQYFEKNSQLIDIVNESAQSWRKPK